MGFWLEKEGIKQPAHSGGCHQLEDVAKREGEAF